jgi:type I restriction enzyme, S subunit
MGMHVQWDRKTLKQLPIEIIDGDRSSKYPKQSEFQADGVLFLNTTNIRDNRLDLSEANYISDAKYSQITKGRVRCGDIVMTTRGTIGKVAYYGHVGKPALINAQMLIIRPSAEAFSSRFVYYLFSSHEMQTTLRNFSSGSAQPQIPIADLKEVAFCYPSLQTQRKIASILSAYDDLIENNTRRIALLEATAQAIYREWFVEFRFPGHEKAKLVDSPLGKIPEGWKRQPLSQVADVNALSIKKGNEPDEVNYVDIASVSTGTIDEVRLLPFSDAPGRARRIVRHGDIIWSTVRPNRKSYSLILKPLENMIASTGFAVISGTKAPFTFLYHALTTEEFVSYLVNHATGSAYPAVNSGDFEKAILLVPSQDVLAAFHDATKEMFLLKHGLQQKNRNLRQTRDLLLPKLISGQLDVENLDIDAGEAADL